jgi:nitroreductase
MKIHTTTLLTITILLTLLTPLTLLDHTQATDGQRDDIILPPPQDLTMIMEQSINRRMSVRQYTTENITDQDLSTILWAAYGTLANGNRTIYHPDHIYGIVLYVIRAEATYTYNPTDHTLINFIDGNYLDIGMYTSPVKIGLVWNQTILPTENDAMSEIGMIAQNIYFDANALNLATITTGMSVSDMYELGLPTDQKPEIIMFLGHPSTPYSFTYQPLPQQNLPQIQNNTMTLAQAINNRHIATSWGSTPLTTFQESQIIWAAYGTSYLYDNINHKHHRTLPSAIDYYPFKLYAANETAVYLYNPSAHSVTTIRDGDHRTEIATAVGSPDISIATAPWILVSVLDTSVGGMQYINWWYYEAGAIAHNIFLEAGTLNLTANTVLFDISDAAGLKTALGISGNNLVPEALSCVGSPSEPTNHAPDQPQLTGQGSGKIKNEYNYTIVTSDPDGDNISYYIEWGDDTTSGWLGPVASGTEVVQSHTWTKKGTYTVRGKAKDTFGAESAWATLQVTMPLGLEYRSPFWEIFFERFPHAFPIIQYILQN